MRCYKCGDIYKKQHGDLVLVDDLIGTYSVHNVYYEKCEQCGGLLYPPSTVRAIEKTRDRIRNEYIQREAIGKFITSAETAKILGISRQALNKNRRIRRGFIYGTNIGEITLYHKESVELFKREGDGRFPLCQHKVIQGKPFKTEPLKFRRFVKENFYLEWMPDNKFSPIYQHTPEFKSSMIQILKNKESALKQSSQLKENVLLDKKEMAYGYVQRI